MYIPGELSHNGMADNHKKINCHVNIMLTIYFQTIASDSRAS